MAKPNYQLKAFILNERYDLISSVKNISKAKYNSYYGTDLHDDFKLSYWLQVEEELINDNSFLYSEALKINKADLNRAVRLKKRIKKYLNLGSCLFLTLTFNDNTLSNTSEDTRRQYVRKWLKSMSSYYVANIDYGKKNGREHYHAVIRLDDITKEDEKLWNRYGFLGVRYIRSTEDYKALGKYIAKLTNHAIKNTTKRSAVIYGES